MSSLLISSCPWDRHFGGVQASAQIALAGMQEHFDAATQLLCHGDNCAGCPLPVGAAHCSHSRPALVWNALRQRGKAAVHLYWHHGFLRVLPLVGKARRILFLHGAECWQPLPTPRLHAMEQMDGFLTNSRFTWQKFLSFHPQFASRRHLVTPLGMQEALPGFTPPTRNQAIVLGRMDQGEAYKGHREMIECWGAVRQQIPDAELLIVGGGNLKPELEALAARVAPPGAVRFAGLLPEAEKQRELAASRCLLLPSRGEGFGLVYLEAMRLGRPCLVSGLDAGTEVVAPPDAGLAANPADAAALTDAMLRLMRPGAEWDRMAEGARARYERQFTAGHFARRLAAAVAEIAA
jgi:phosphatidyl-myo-inositol dimannoside synthase